VKLDEEKVNALISQMDQHLAALNLANNGAAASPGLSSDLNQTGSVSNSQGIY
jgi:hypothetical protein